jgi:hypothetical protein
MDNRRVTLLAGAAVFAVMPVAAGHHTVIAGLLRQAVPALSGKELVFKP